MNVMQMFDLTGQVAVITGAGNGLGYAFAEAMAEAGADVVCGDIDSAGNERTAARIRELGRRATALYLASVGSSFTTGLMLVTDGGCMAK